MSLVSFKYRESLPTNPEAGTFYWISDESLWFASNNGLLRLDNKFDKSELDEIILRLSGVDSDIENINFVLEELQNKINGLFDYLMDSDLDDFVTRDELIEEVENAMEGYSPELEDSDWDRIEEKISEKVNEKSLNLTWKEI